MMVATFGDLAGPGSLHLDAGAALRDSGLRGQPTAAQEASRLAVTLSRYLADIVPLDEVGAIASGQADGWERAVVDAREALPQNLPHRRRRYLHSQAGQLAVDPAVAIRGSPGPAGGPGP